ncbi:MAG TPA: tetratricopeptide repeat protein [Candidatus Acidoferrum sp.]|nr:tetratricopeptide repeat protein [Candidatus Acidoferrum sp.]
MKRNSLRHKAVRHEHLRRLAAALALAILLIGGGAGCSRDPNVRKQKFLQQGNADFAKGRYPEAAISYGRAIQLDPKFAEAHFKLAQTYLKQGSLAAGYQELMRTVALQPENWDAQLDIAKMYLAGGKAQDAKDKALLILKSNPANGDAQIVLSQANSQLGNAADAMQQAKDAVGTLSDKPAPYINLAIMQEKSGALSDAEATLLKARSLDTTTIGSLMVLGHFYERQKRWADAEKQFQAAIQQEPKNPVPRSELAVLYLNQGNQQQAINVLTQAKQDLKDDPRAYRMLGDYYFSRGELAKAMDEFASITAQHPTDAQAKKLYIQLLLLNQKPDEANRLNEEILKKNPQDSDALVVKGQILNNQKKWDESIQVLRQVTKNAPDNATGHFLLGVALAAKADPQEAEHEWHEATRLRPGYAEAWRDLGTMTTQRRDWKGLEVIANKLETVAPRSPEGYLFHATARFNQSDATAAEADVNHVIQMAPQSPLGYVKLGEMRMAQKRVNDAEAAYRQALSRDPHSLEAIEGLMGVAYSRSKPADALKLAEDQLQQAPDNQQLLNLVARAQMNNHQPEDAERTLLHAVELDKQNVAAIALLADVQVLQRKPEAAIANYQRAAEISPTDARLYMAIGSQSEALGKWEQAETAYQKVLSLRPDEPVASNNLAYLLLEHGGSVNVALTLAQNAHKGLPNLPSSADTLGWAYFRNGAFSVAAPLFEDAIKKKPENLTYHYHLGLTYQKLNDSAKARAELQKVISLDPKSPVAEQARQALNGTSGNS